MAKPTLKQRYEALEKASWDYWREVNNGILAAGGSLSTVQKLDGSVSAMATINGITFDRTPPIWRAKGAS